MPRDRGFSAFFNIVKRGVYSALPPMLDDYIIVDPHRPARVPHGKVIFQCEAMNLCVFGRLGHQLLLEAAIMVAEGPSSEGVGGRLLELKKPIPACDDFILDGGEVGVADALGWVAANGSPVKYVTVLHDHLRLVILAKLDHRTVSRRFNMGPVMGVRSNDGATILNLKGDPLRVLDGLPDMIGFSMRVLQRAVEGFL